LQDSGWNLHANLGKYDQQQEASGSSHRAAHIHSVFSLSEIRKVRWAHMADDARISTALPRHPKTVKLHRRLGAPGCWGFVCLLLWVADNRYDGDLQGLTDEDLEIAAGWTGNAGEFVRVLCEVRFLEGETGSYRVHDWAEHNPWAANRNQRVEAARAAANHRWAPKSQHGDGCEADAGGMHGACEPDKSAMPDSPRTTRTTRTHAQKDNGAVAPAEWIPIEAWAPFIKMRRKKKNPLTDDAVNLIVKKLEKLRAEGHDVGEVLNESTMNGWSGVFPLRGDHGNGNGSRSSPRTKRNLTALEIVKRKNAERFAGSP
jgi:hypothetical protein